jgi:acetyl esterase/lipase
MIRNLSWTYVIWMLVSAVCVAAPGLGQAPERHLAYSLPAPAGVRVINNQSYRSLAGTKDTIMYGPNLLYDVFLPGATADRRPRAGVVFIHGGLVPDTQRVSPKDDLKAYREWGNLVAASGLVAITFSHRLSTADNLDVATDDVTELLRLVRARATEWNLDPDRLCVAVFSAGGPLASLFLRPTRQSGVRCVAMYYPFLDTEHVSVHTAFRSAHSVARVGELARFSPRAALLTHGSAVPPMLVARAGRDAIPGINASIERFVQSALWVNAALDFYVHPTGAHGFDMTATPDPRAADIVSATVAFFHRHLDTF